jgi:hypothetical protein
LKSYQIPLHPPFKRGKELAFREDIQKSSPPFEKGRTGGVFEPIIQKANLIRKGKIFWKRKCAS